VGWLGGLSDLFRMSHVVETFGQRFIEEPSRRPHPTSTCSRFRQLQPETDLWFSGVLNW